MEKCNKYWRDRKIHQRKKRWSNVIILIPVMLSLFVCCDFSDSKTATAKNISGSNTLGKTTGLMTASDVPQKAVQNQGDDVVITDKEVEKAYKKLLKEGKKKTEDIKSIKAEKGSYYLVTLVSGRSLQAVVIETKGNRAIITDNTGMVISLDKQEISGIEKVEERGE